MKKTVFTLCVDNYAPEITKLTFPLLERYANKIGAKFQIITERKWPKLPPVYEKLQIHELGKENDWNIFIDADALVHPDFFDPTNHLTKDTVMHHRCDLAGNRWRYDKYFLRDGRHLGSCNWFTIGSNWCIDLWKPLDDLTFEEAVENIFPTQTERQSGITREHLIDDYTVSRNIAKYGLKVKTLYDLQKFMDRLNESYLWHKYLIPAKEKAIEMRGILQLWGLV